MGLRIVTVTAAEVDQMVVVLPAAPVVSFTFKGPRWFTPAPGGAVAVGRSIMGDGSFLVEM